MPTWRHVDRSNGREHLPEVLRHLCGLVGIAHDLQQVFVAHEVEPAERLCAQQQQRHR